MLIAMSDSSHNIQYRAYRRLAGCVLAVNSASGEGRQSSTLDHPVLQIRHGFQPPQARIFCGLNQFFQLTHACGIGG